MITQSDVVGIFVAAFFAVAFGAYVWMFVCVEVTNRQRMKAIDTIAKTRLAAVWRGEQLGPYPILSDRLSYTKHFWLVFFFRDVKPYLVEVKP